MKLLHVIASTNPESGGPIEALLRISEVLIRDGHEVTVASLEAEKQTAGRSFPFPVIGLGAGSGKYRYNSRLVSWLKENACSFDAVILHGLWNYSSLGSWQALKKSSTPYYVFAHGMMDPWFRKRYPLKHIAKQIFWTIGEGRVLRDARSVLFTCEEEMLRSRNVFHGYSYREQVVLLGTADPAGDASSEKAAFQRSFPGILERQFLLFLSRIHPKKGCDLLIQAFSDAASEIPADVDLVMAGPDQTGWVPELQALAKRAGIANRIHWIGMVKGEVKWGAYRSATAMILPSHQENFGIVVAEAMACSTPVLISDKVNIWREVNASHAGLVEADTLNGTRELIRRFFALSAVDRSLMATNAREGFLRHFDIEATAFEFERAIGFMVDKHQTSSTVAR